jgi:predicted ATPase/DNA-binding winged helix-turn-helix (wHTH) protein
MTAEVSDFGRFRLCRRTRELRADGVLLDLNDRGFDILLALIDANGATVSKTELMRLVWPGLTVTENNLEVQISALRRLFGNDRDMIKTISGRGYRLLGTATSAPAQPGVPGINASGGNLPGAVDELVGRENDLEQIGELLRKHRLLTLVGPGGIGKTTLSLAAARALLDDHPDGVWLIELATVTDANALLGLLASTLQLQRLPLATGPLSPGADILAAGLTDRRLLLILDNCEHILEPVAQLAETLLARTRNVRILATSREPLRAQHEYIYHVPPLATPPDVWMDTDALVDHAALRLFLQRARAMGASFPVDAEMAQTINDICCRLDGIPLAIELAAARAAFMGPQAVAESLDDRFELLKGGRRTAHWRHQTLRATMDWSYDLLGAAERTVLSRLSVFNGSFTLQAAESVANGGHGARADAADDVPDIVGCLTSLVLRSLISLDSTTQTMRYRLLETMRAYGLEKLPPDEATTARRLHLMVYARLLDATNADCGDSEPATLDTGDFENVRGALLWGLTAPDATPADAVVGITLAVAFMPLLLEASMHSECCRWADLALKRIGPAQCEQELVLQVVRGNLLLATGATETQAEQALQRGLALAHACGNHEYALRALYGLWVLRLHQHDYVSAYALAEQFHATAPRQQHDDDLTIGRRLIATSDHYLGRQAQARRALEQVLGAPVLAPRRSRESRFGLDQSVAALTTMARVLVLQGALDRGMDTARRAVDAARQLDRVVSFCHALGELCIVSLWTGTHVDLARNAAQLMDHAERYGLRFWRPHALVAQGCIAASLGQPSQASSLFSAAMTDAGGHRFDLLYPSLVGPITQGLDGIGQREPARRLIDQALGRDWARQRANTPELLAMRGQLKLTASDPVRLHTAQDDFEQAISWARRQSSALLELRAAIGLANLGEATGRPELGLKPLQDARARFSEGFGTTHLQAAQTILRRLQTDSSPAALGIEAH